MHNTAAARVLATTSTAVQQANATQAQRLHRLQLKDPTLQLRRGAATGPTRKLSQGTCSRVSHRLTAQQVRGTARVGPRGTQLLLLRLQPHPMPTLLLQVSLSVHLCTTFECAAHCQRLIRPQLRRRHLLQGVQSGIGTCVCISVCVRVCVHCRFFHTVPAAAATTTTAAATAAAAAVLHG